MKNKTYARTRTLQMNRRRRKWELLAAAPLCIVAMALALLLTMRPAATQESAYICGMGEHIHAGDCYAQQLMCEIPEESGEDAHIHEGACYVSELVCLFTEHIHTTECYVPEEPLFEPFEGADFGLFSIGSWDLSDYLDNFIVTESGTLIYNYQSGGLQPGKSFVYGMDYDFRIEFSAPNSNFDYPTYNDGGGDLDGYMVFALPDGMTISQPTMSGPLGTISGSYTIFTDTSNHSYVLIRFDGDLLDQYNNDGNPYGFWVAFTARFKKIGNDGKYEFGDDIVIELDPNGDDGEGKLILTKSDNGGFKNANDTVAYTVTVTVKNDAYHLTHLVDTLTFNGAPVSNAYAKISGVSITKGGAPFSAFTVAAGTNGNEWVITFTGGVTLNDGESLVINYTFDCSSLINKGSNPLWWGEWTDRLKNVCEAFDGGEKLGEVELETSLWFRFASKNVYHEIWDLQNGFELVDGVMYIRYVVVIGSHTDDSRPLNGMTITDTLEPGNEYVPERPSKCKVESLYGMNYNGSPGWPTDGLIENFLPAPPANTFSIVVPETDPPIYRLQLEYWTKVNDPANWNPKNSITVDDLGTYEYETGPGAFRGQMKKTGQFTGGTINDSIEWEIKVFIPKEMYNNPSVTLLLEDWCMLHTGGEAGILAIPLPTDISEYTITYSPQPQSGIPADLMEIYEQSGDNSLAKFRFNTTNHNSPFQVDTWLSIKYETPLNMVLSSGKTVYEELTKNVKDVWPSIENRLQGLYAGISGWMGNNVTLRWPVRKMVFEPMTNTRRVTYRVLINSDGSGSAFKDGWVFTDTFDPKLRYVPGSFHVRNVNNLGGLMYGWNFGYGEFDANGDYVDWINCPGNVLTVDFADLYSANWENSMGFWSPTHINEGGPQSLSLLFSLNCTYEVYYTLELRDYHDDPQEDLINTASMSGFNSSWKQTYKQAPGIKGLYRHEGNTVVAVIDVNPRGIMLGTAGSEPASYIAYDTMSPNMEIIPDSLEISIVKPEHRHIFPTHWTQVLNPGMSDAPLTLSDDLFSYYINSLQEIEFHFPNGTPILITYRATVVDVSGTGTERVENTITLFGKGYSDWIDQFKINDHTGGSWIDRNEVTLFKRDSETDELLDGAHFALYVRLPNDKQPPITAPSGIAQSIADTQSGYTFWYIQDAWTVNGKIVFHRWLYPNASPPPIYMLVELTPPPNYVADDPTTFFAFKSLPGPEATALSGRRFVHITDGTITVTNTYTDEKSVTVYLNALKNVLGGEMEADQFNFALYAIGENGEETLALTAKNEDAGMSSHVHFGPLTFTEPGTYMYYLVEEGAVTGWAMDPTRYLIVIEVELDTQSGELVADVSFVEVDENGAPLGELRPYDVELPTLWPDFQNAYGMPRLPETGSTGTGLYIAVGIAGLCLMVSLTMYIKSRNRKMILR
ncbi:MAG: LPXTG cell wall anchor domain-containing protein [Clostridiales bacterium]|nr:LPXTG cell wall anchor domain-containing protein [Clostridiales bacterium]